MRQETMDYLNKVAKAMNEVASAIRKETDEVEATKDHIEVIRHYNSLRAVNEIIKTARKALDETEDHLSKTGVPDVMRLHGIKTINIEGVGRVSISNRYSCSMVDKEGGMRWLEENGHEGLIQRTVNSTTLSSFARSLLEDEGIELPEELFKVSTQSYTSITKK